MMNLRFSFLFSLCLAASIQAVCYNDTKDMLLAQVAGETQLEICAGTTLELGGIPISSDLTQWSAMTPLVIIQDDVEVYCGSDKKSSNNCVLQGGVLQIVTSVFNPLLAGVPTNSTNNLKVTGLTFQGNITDIPGLFGATPVAIGAPGTNIVFDDCIFQDLNTTHVVNLARNMFTAEEDFPPDTAEVTITNSVFRNILFSLDVILNSEQTMNLNNISMTNITYNPTCGCTYTAVFELNNASTTTLHNVTMNYIETYSAIVHQLGDGTEFNYDETFLVQNASIYNQSSRPEYDYCPGILKETISGENYTGQCVPLENPNNNDNNEGTTPPLSPTSSTISRSKLGMTVAAMIVTFGLFLLDSCN